MRHPTPRIPTPGERPRTDVGRATLVLLLALAVTIPAAAQRPRAAVDDPDLSTLGGPKQHQKRQKRPIQLGTSGGNVNDFTTDGRSIVCCSGTLGGLLRKGDEHFILSNNHVLALTNKGQPGDAVSQPGRLDNRCRAPGKNLVGSLSDFKKLKLDRGKNKADAAIAAVDAESVDLSGSIVGIGVPGNETVDPSVGMPVQKSGRTTGVTRGIVDLVNGTFLVAYSTACSQDAELHEARFVKQFRIVSADGTDFSAGGDSGSVILEDRDSCPGQVGLLFAGNSAFTVANRMRPVLKAVKKMKPKGKAELVGCDKSAPLAQAALSTSPVPELDGRVLRLAERIQARAEVALLALEGVHGLGIGRSSQRPDRPAFKVLIDQSRPEAAAQVPTEIEGIPVEVELTEPIVALGCPGR